MEKAITRNLTQADSLPLASETLIANRLARAGQRNVAISAGVNESTVSRWKDNGYFRQVSRVIDALGLKVVPGDAVTVEPDYLSSLQVLADIGLKVTSLGSNSGAPACQSFL